MLESEAVREVCEESYMSGAKTQEGGELCCLFVTFLSVSQLIV